MKTTTFRNSYGLLILLLSTLFAFGGTLHADIQGDIAAKTAAIDEVDLRLEDVEDDIFEVEKKIKIYKKDLKSAVTTAGKAKLNKAIKKSLKTLKSLKRSRNAYEAELAVLDAELDVLYGSLQTG